MLNDQDYKVKVQIGDTVYIPWSRLKGANDDTLHGVFLTQEAAEECGFAGRPRDIVSGYGVVPLQVKG